MYAAVLQMKQLDPLRFSVRRPFGGTLCLVVTLSSTCVFTYDPKCCFGCILGNFLESECDLATSVEGG